VFSSAFIFKPGTYDDEFRRLDAATQAVAESTEGYLGSGTWWSDNRTVCDAIYCWADLAHLSDFAQAVPHRAAKARYDGYQVVVAEVRGAYGDGRLPHLTSPVRETHRSPPGLRAPGH
jgi:hypothetical protein